MSWDFHLHIIQKDMVVHLTEDCNWKINMIINTIINAMIIDLIYYNLILSMQTW